MPITWPFDLPIPLRSPAARSIRHVRSAPQWGIWLARMCGDKAEARGALITENILQLLKLMCIKNNNAGLGWD